MKLFHGDCRDVIKTLPACSVDSVVTDPPYSLVSIQKRFGKPGSAPAQHGRDGLYKRASAGFMNKQWDTGETAFDPAFWAEVLRVLKPGGHLLAFGGTRTYHRLAVAIEDAGFEIRDQIGWLYGSGFPKSHDVSKGIDKAAGAERELVKPRSVISHQRSIGNRRPYMDDPDHMTVSDEPVSDDAKQWQGWGTALKPAWEPIVLARKPIKGTVAANVLEHGTGALNIDGCRVPLDGEKPYSYPNGRGGEGWHGRESLSTNLDAPLSGNPAGRWPANVIHDGSEEVLAEFAKYGESKSQPHGGDGKPLDTRGAGWGFKRMPGGFDDRGTPARFFYSAKAGQKDRRGSKHPTVKPISLLRYLCRLITPPGGVVLDPFAGSGTTGEAAIEEGFVPWLIEREDEYFADIQRRMQEVVFAA